jgi:monofunctional biosynthetic peptidoglycan transglycosylase
LIALASIAFGPVLLIFPLRFVDPLFTAHLLGRAVERYRQDRTPIFPKRTVVPLESMSPELKRAVLASEDDGFYLHHGFDVRQIERAVQSNKKGGHIRGASTISQQTVKNLFLWSGRSYARKAVEAYFTVYLELLLPKDRILEIYLNLVECSDGLFGVELCARHIFEKPASQLDASEAARLAAVLPSPRKIDPFGDYATERAMQILDIMQRPILKP